MKKIGFLSFGHWSAAAQSQTRSASDNLLQSIDLSVAAEELGLDGAYFRVHHFARQHASPFPLLAAIGLLALWHVAGALRGWLGARGDAGREKRREDAWT